MIINNSNIFSSFLFLIILSLLVERTLSVFFEQKFISKFLQGKGIKEFIALILCYIVCQTWNIDVVSNILGQTSNTLGIILSACSIAGGSKASITLFRDIINASNTKP